MGNRAAVIFHEADERPSPAVYLHWNGGPESVYAFLDELDRRRVRCDAEYAAARFVHIVCDYFDGRDRATADSVGFIHAPARSLNRFADVDPGDNGVYVVSRKGGRKVRRFKDGNELDDLAVKAERERAYRHAYITDPDGIPATLRALRPNIG